MLPQEIQDIILVELLKLCLNPGIIELEFDGRQARVLSRRDYHVDQRIRFTTVVDYPTLDVSIFKALNKRWANKAFSILYCDNIWALPCVYHPHHFPDRRLRDLFSQRWRIEDILKLPRVQLDPYPVDLMLSDELPYLFEFKRSDTDLRPFEASLLRILIDARGCEGLTLDDLRPGQQPVTLTPEEPKPMVSAMWIAGRYPPLRHIPYEPDDTRMVCLRNGAKKRLLQELLAKPEYTDRISAFLQSYWPDPEEDYQITLSGVQLNRRSCHNIDHVVAEEQSHDSSCFHSVRSLSGYLWTLVTEKASKVIHGR